MRMLLRTIEAFIHCVIERKRLSVVKLYDFEKIEVAALWGETVGSWQDMLIDRATDNAGC